MKVYLVQRGDGIHVFSTKEKALADICYNNVSVELNAQVHKVEGEITQAYILERFKNRSVIRFEYEGEDIWLLSEEVR